MIWAGYDDSPDLYHALDVYVSGRIWGRHRTFGPARALAIAESGKVVAAVIYHNWDDESGVIELSAASDTPRWLTRRVLKTMFEYPFLDLGCQAVVMRVGDDGHNLARILPVYGFKRYDIPRLRGRDKTEQIYVLSDDDWKANKFNKGSR